METKQTSKEKIKKKAGLFFHSTQWKNKLAFFIFVLLAFIFWMMQYLQQTKEHNITLSVNYTDIPNDIVLKDSTPYQITLKLEDEGSNILKHYYSSKNRTIDISLRETPLKTNHIVIEKSQLLNEIENALSNTSKLLSFTPETIDIRYSPMGKKEVPVRIDGKIIPAPGYIFTDSLHIEPSHVWVYGEKTNLDTLLYIYTTPIKRENIQKDLDLLVHLKSPQGLRLSSDQVKISSAIEEYTEKMIELHLLCNDLPEDIDIRLFPSTVKVACQIALSQYAILTEKDIAIHISYKDLLQAQGTTISLDLTKKPEWLINYRIIPATVEFLIERK